MGVTNETNPSRSPIYQAKKPETSIKPNSPIQFRENERMFTTKC